MAKNKKKERKYIHKEKMPNTNKRSTGPLSRKLLWLGASTLSKKKERKYIHKDKLPNSHKRSTGPLSRKLLWLSARQPSTMANKK
jgi:hypothetical protein